MKSLFFIALLAFGVSFFLPALREAAGLTDLLSWSHDVAARTATLTPKLGQESPLGPAAGGEALFGALRRPESTGDGEFRGYHAARLVLESLEESFGKGDGFPASKLAEVIWINLANPLFLLAAIAGLLGATRIGGLAAALGVGSALYWITTADLEPKMLGVGYWLWLASFALAAIALLFRSRSSGSAKVARAS